MVNIPEIEKQIVLSGLLDEISNRFQSIVTEASKRLGVCESNRYRQSAIDISKLCAEVIVLVDRRDQIAQTK